MKRIIYISEKVASLLDSSPRFRVWIHFPYIGLKPQTRPKIGFLAIYYILLLLFHHVFRAGFEFEVTGTTTMVLEYPKKIPLVFIAKNDDFLPVFQQFF